MARVAKKTEPAVAYSYLRFSSPEQGKGDSLRRQTELRDRWIAKSGAVLDTSLSMTDAGVSAFTGSNRENPDRHALAAFVSLVESGRVRRGSYLIVESLDRLSREHIRPALRLLLDLIDHGIRVVQLLPAEAVYDEDVEPMALMMAIMELSRGHSESRMKSERVVAAWRAKKAAAAESSVPLTKMVPAWLKVVGDKFVVREDRAAAVRRVYELAVAGYGVGVITKRLNVEGVPPIGRNGIWARSYVGLLLSSRAVVGEFQPHRGRGGTPRKPDGAPIPNYFPAVIAEEQWHAARAALTGRRTKGGRIGRRVNLFSGLLRDARDGGSFQLVNKGSRSRGPWLANYRGRQGVVGAKVVTFPLSVFEAAILSRLREVDPRDILPGSDRSADQVMELAGKLGTIEGKIERVKAELVAGEDVAPLIDVLKKLDASRQQVAGKLAAARQAAASPLSQAWGDTRSLLDALSAAPDETDARTRLRSALRRIIEGVWCLFVPDGHDRIAAIQIYFAGGRHRDYLVRYKSPGKASGPDQWECRSFVASARSGELDLRKQAHAKKLESVLAGLDLAAATAPQSACPTGGLAIGPKAESRPQITARKAPTPARSGRRRS